VTLVGSRTFSKQGQAECAEFVADQRVNVERLFTHRWKLEQAEEGLPALRYSEHGQGRHPAVLTLTGMRTPNLKTAKALDLTILANLLSFADQAIE
jgi:hypothetical protein